MSKKDDEDGRRKEGRSRRADGDGERGFEPERGSGFGFADAFAAARNADQRFSLLEPD